MVDEHQRAAALQLQLERGAASATRAHLSQLGKAHGRPDLQAAGQRLSNESGSLLEDDESGRQRRERARRVSPPLRCGRADYDMSQLPAVSGTIAPYNDRASEPWRSYSGMLYPRAGRQGGGEIVRYNQNRRLSKLGIWSGVGWFDNQLMSFTEQGHGYGLLQHDHIELFLLQFFAEMAHACTRGSWTCFESRVLPQGTPGGGYTTPRSRLCRCTSRCSWKSRSAVVTLCRGTPRAWLGHGERIEVHGAPTSSAVST